MASSMKNGFHKKKKKRLPGKGTISAEEMVSSRKKSFHYDFA